MNESITVPSKVALKLGISLFSLIPALALHLVPTAAHASPIFAIGEGTGTTWTQAIADGNVVPVSSADGLTGAATSYYGDRLLNDPTLDGFLLQTATLIPDVLETDGNNETHLAMRMEWPVTGNNDPGNDVLDIAAWEYVYGVDPDLTNTFLQFTILARAGVTDLSLELIDVNGKAKGWFKPGPVTENWGVVTFDVNLNVPQNGFTVFQEPGFDLTSVAKIRLDETWRGKVVPVQVGSNAWDSLRVTPEPTAFTLLAFGGLMLARRRRRMR